MFLSPSRKITAQVLDWDIGDISAARKRWNQASLRQWSIPKRIKIEISQNEFKNVEVRYQMGPNHNLLVLHDGRFITDYSRRELYLATTK